MLITMFIKTLVVQNILLSGLPLVTDWSHSVQTTDLLLQVPNGESFL